MRFVDTNVLLYALSTATADQRKRRTAQAILSEPDLALSAQVLQEFFVQATRTSRVDRLSYEDAEEAVATFSERPIRDISAGLVMAAIATQRRYQISYWDAAVIEAARDMGCDEVLSEDLNDGQDYDGVVVRNPFVSG